MCNRRQHPKLHGKCDNKIWRVDALDAQVVSDIIFLCKSEKRYNAQIAAQSGIISKKNPLESSEKINALNQQVDVLTRKYNRAVKMSLDVEDERLSVSYSQEAQNISEQIASARKAIEDLRKSIARAYAAPITYGEAHVLANDLENVLHSGDSQEAQRIIRKLIYRIDVDGDDLYYTLTGSAQEK